jgi:hypothetical protein
VKEKKRIYYMSSRWPNRNGTNNIAIMPLKSYYDGNMYTDNKWDSDEEEGVKQFFYKKENTEDEYVYATILTIKTDKEVGPAEVVIPYRGKVKQEEYTFDWSTKIHIPCEFHYETWINLSTAILDLYALNARNKYRNLHLVKEEKEIRTLEFKINDNSPQKIEPTSVVSIAPVTPPTVTKEEKKEED